MKWHPVELHTHTQHSDGDFTVSELVHAAKQRGFHAVCLSDHNTMSGLPELYEAAQGEHIVPIPAIEWTTYWGHMLVLDEHGYTDWRGVRPEQIDAAIASIHRNQGLVGIAHPFALDNPVNTGYHWNFQVTDWEEIDFLEVWSRDYAPCKIQSFRALHLWETLLARGFHITATSGRDWHREDTFHYAHTYVLAAKNLTKESILRALKAGRVCLSAGPLLTMKGSLPDGTHVQVGDTIGAGILELELDLDEWTMPNDWEKTAVIPKEIQLVQNGEILCRLAPETSQLIRLNAVPGWLRADLTGTYYGKKDQKIALTNPIYIN
ncbi:MAG: CehA/McbA family metallohydrolase [Eubacteriales bacterium]|nr:CehA/McbA family metallohydrolase [Eubacteriales bacterium]